MEAVRRLSRQLVLVSLGLLGALLGCPGPGADRSGGRPQEVAAAPVAGPSSSGEVHLAQVPEAHGSRDHGTHSGGGHEGHRHGGEGGHRRHGPGERSGSALRRPGEEVQDFAVTSMAGGAFRLGSLRRTADTAGKIVVLTFWCTTCHSCRDVERDFDAKAKEYAAKGVHFLMVDSNYRDTVDRVNQFLEVSRLGFTVLMDPEGEVARYFGATLTTTTAVVDVDGRLRYYGGFAGAEDAVRSLIAGAPVAAPESPADG